MISGDLIWTALGTKAHQPSPLPANPISAEEGTEVIDRLIKSVGIGPIHLIVEGLWELINRPSASSVAEAWDNMPYLIIKSWLMKKTTRKMILEPVTSQYKTRSSCTNFARHQAGKPTVRPTKMIIIQSIKGEALKAEISSKVSRIAYQSPMLRLNDRDLTRK